MQTHLDGVEEWRDIPGYEGLYQVSDMGRVWSIRSRKTLSPLINPNGYLYVNLYQEYAAKRLAIHVLVALSFIGPRPIDHHVDHVNHKRTDNRLANLQYLHKTINYAQSPVHLYGEKNSQSKLTDRQRCDIQRIWESPDRPSVKELARIYQVSMSVIEYVVYRRSEKHIDCSKYD